MGGVYFFSSFYLQNVRGYSPLEAGLLAVPFAVGQFVMSPRSAAAGQAGSASARSWLAGMLVNAVAIGGWAFLGTSSPIWIVAVLFFVQGSGLGLAVPAATSSVMEALPRERAGAGSALTNTARQVAVALSVAVLGSILSQAYRNSLDPTLSALPAAARNAAGSSITATQAVAAQLGHAGQFLLAPADSAFVDAMRITTAIAAALAVVGGARGAALDARPEAAYHRGTGRRRGGGRRARPRGRPAGTSRAVGTVQLGSHKVKPARSGSERRRVPRHAHS